MDRLCKQRLVGSGYLFERLEEPLKKAITTLHVSKISFFDYTFILLCQRCVSSMIFWKSVQYICIDFSSKGGFCVMEIAVTFLQRWGQIAQWISSTLIVQILPFLGGVYMTPGRLSRRHEFTPVPSHGSTFVCMIPPQNVMPARVTPAWVHPGCCTGVRISLRYENSQRYHVNAKRPPTSVWIRSAGDLEQVAYA